VATNRRETAKARLSRLMKPNPFRLVEREDYWRDPKIRAEAARAALNAENLEEPIRLAFEAFKLDPLSPHDWRLLLFALASIHFGIPKGKAGKPKAWRDSDWCELLADFYQVAATHRTPHKKSAVCRTMIKDKSLLERHWFKALASIDPNKPLSERSGTIRRNVNRALNYKENNYLRLVDELSARRITAGKETANPWTERDELLARSSACRDLIPAIEALSGRRRSQS
jgi:hypothetical protein